MRWELLWCAGSQIMPVDNYPIHIQDIETGHRKHSNDHYLSLERSSRQSYIQLTQVNIPLINQMILLTDTHGTYLSFNSAESAATNPYRLLLMIPCSRRGITTERTLLKWTGKDSKVERCRRPNAKRG